MTYKIDCVHYRFASDKNWQSAEEREHFGVKSSSVDLCSYVPAGKLHGLIEVIENDPTLYHFYEADGNEPVEKAYSLTDNVCDNCPFYQKHA